MNHHADVAIIGGGIIGLSLALSLAKYVPQIKIIIFESKKPLPHDVQSTVLATDNGLLARIYAISPNNIAYLKDIGVWNDLLLQPAYINKMAIYANQKHANQPPTLSLQAEDDITTSAANNYLAGIISEAKLHCLLLQHSMQYANINIINTPPQSFKYHQTSQRVLITDKQANQYLIKLAVGADGANSWLRQQIKSLNVVQEHRYNSGALVANFACSKEHHNVAHQWFLPQGILAFLPLNQANNISIVYSTQEAWQIAKLNIANLNAKIEQDSLHTLGKLTMLSEKPAVFPLAMNTPKHIYAYQAVLIGDAAHTIHPLAGMGINLGLGDCQELIKQIAKTFLLPEDDYTKHLKHALQVYSSKRKIKVASMQQFCHTLHQVFTSDACITKNCFTYGMNLINSCLPAKRSIVSKMHMF